jgi:predicted site-specific integrase-resolvase
MAKPRKRFPHPPQAVGGREVFTSKEISEMFNIPRSTLHRWVKQGKLIEPAMDVGGNYVWTQTEVNAISKFLSKGGAVA